MELSPRKKAVLSAIIKNYIETGEPVGSKILTELIENAPSSATLRNEMSELCNLGFLEQPHTSAGRVPTSRGLRLYVNSLMNPVKLSESAKRFIDEGLADINCDPEQIPAKVGRIISDLTGLPAISCIITEEEITVKRIELLPIGLRSMMLLIITSDGRARNRIFRTSVQLNDSVLDNFNDICKRKIRGKAVTELNKPYMQNVIAAAGIDSLTLLPLLTAVFEMAGEIENSSVNLSGETCLYNISADEESARKIISLIKRRDPIISLMNSIPDNAGVVFGSDTKLEELSSGTIVAARFGAKSIKGTLAVIGPHRISYEEVIPSVEYAASRLTTLMGEALKDMED
ncbi:MAG: heat-inducible transcription repressor HrcA [Clostridia bacterium]|nr:heat-inducible transcription repressor HrcA [Clostridia bacterium]MEE1185311.1 heat-inducible transcriptional repressor HrcA [Acutalibacteraceae bacterium]